MVVIGASQDQERGDSWPAGTVKATGPEINPGRLRQVK